MHIMNLQDTPFESIKNGTKTIEMRLYDEKRSRINVGDIIEFNNFKTNEVLRVKVLKLHIFNNFTELYSKFDKVSLGYKSNEQAIPNDMEKYYSKKDIEKYGVVGIEIERI